LLCTASLSAQTFYNNGQVYVRPNAIIHINGNCETDGAAAILENEGEFTAANSTLQGDFIINNAGIVQGDGNYYIEGDWNNNATFAQGVSYVNLSGGNQLITGTVSTTYYDLELTGTGIKTQTIDATVEDSLMLNDRELATDVNTMFMTNTNIGTITNDQTLGSEGFASSLGNGSLSWMTASANAYRFPVGSSLGTTRYREVELTPALADTNTYTVRLVNNDPTIDTLDVKSLDTTLCLVNDLYYHKINRTVGTDAADVRIYYDANDGIFDALAQWNTPTTTIWNDMSPVASTTGNYNSHMVTSWNDFSFDPFALALTGPVFAGMDTISGGYYGNIFVFTDTSGGSPSTWEWDFGDGTGSSSQNPQHEYTGTGSYTVILIVTSATGCVDTVEVVINIDEGIQIPNVFSPNGDGINDQFIIPTSGIGDYKLSIFNRWGTLIFESVASEIVWDGRTFAGKEVPDGTYYFILTAVSTTTDYSTTGYLTLLRRPNQ